MVLDHVPQGARSVVITGATAYPQVFCHRDLDILDTIPVPDRFEEWVGQPEDQQVLHGGLAKVMVDAKYLGFVETLMEGPVQRNGRFEVDAEWLLHHQTGPSGAVGQSRCSQGLDRRAQGGWRQGQVEDPVSLEAVGSLDLFDPAPEGFERPRPSIGDGLKIQDLVAPLARIGIRLPELCLPVGDAFDRRPRERPEAIVIHL